MGTEGNGFERQAVEGAEIRYVDWFLPGILGMNIMFACLFGVGFVIVRYRKNGFLKRLKATPLGAFQFSFAQLVSRLLLVMLVTTIVYTGCNIFIKFNMQHSYWDLLLRATAGRSPSTSSPTVPTASPAETPSNITPRSGQRFLWVTLSVRNDARSSREFSFESCAINQGDTAYLPLYVGMNFGYQAQITKTPVLDPAEEITRKLAFGYPEAVPPERLICFGNEIPLQQKK